MLKTRVVIVKELITFKKVSLEYFYTLLDNTLSTLKPLVELMMIMTEELTLKNLKQLKTLWRNGLVKSKIWKLNLKP